MKLVRRLPSALFLLLAHGASSLCFAADPVAAPAAPAPATPSQDVLKHLVNEVLALFGVPANANTGVHYAVAGIFLVAAIFLRHVVTRVVFHFLKKLAARTETTLDDKLFPEMEAPTATMIMVVGIFAALEVLTLPPGVSRLIGFGFTTAFSLVIFWGVYRAFNAVLDHMQEVAVQKNMGVAAFMPWIKKTLIAIFLAIGLLLVVQSLGYDVKTIFAAAGIGGLAFALAAQDTIANFFGSLVVATDQPFKIGEMVRVSGSVGTIEDIGLRSTKIRLLDRSLIAIPNKTMASEAIVNLSRFTQRRIEQTLGLTYDTTPEQMELILADLRTLLAADEGVEKQSINVFFTEFGESALNILVIYHAISPDYKNHLRLREQINLKIMRAIAARGLSMAFPTRTLLLDGPVAKQLASAKAAPRN